MGKIIPLRNPGNYRRAHQRIRALWEEREVINHAKRRMQERGFDMTDIEHAIRYGRVTDHSKPHAWWRYVLDDQVRGREADAGGGGDRRAPHHRNRSPEVGRRCSVSVAGPCASAR